MRETGLELSASTNAGAPDSSLSGLASSFLQQHVGRGTQQVTRTTAGASVQAGWTDHTGSTYSLLVVTTSPEHGSLLLGVAALRSDPLKKPHPVAFYVTSAIGACLLEAGDARGAAV